MPDEFVLINIYANPHEADLVRIFLEQQGITVYLENRLIIETDWLLSNAIGGIRLQVPASQAQDAIELMKEVARWPRNPLGLKDELSNALACFECGNPMTEDEEACPQCGWSFTAGEPDQEETDDQSALEN